MSLSIPSDDPQWDTTQANSVEPTTEQVSGWTNGGEIESTYFNWWMNLVWLWIQYLKSCLTEHISIGASRWALVTSGLFTGGALLDNVSWLNGAGTQLLAYELDLPVGAKVTSLTAGYSRGGSGGTVSLILSIITAGTDGGVTYTLFADASGSAYETTTVADADFVSIVGASLVIEAGKIYRLSAKMTANTNAWVGITDLTYQRATTP